MDIKKKILLIEDNEVLSELLIELLSENYDVHYFNNASEALLNLDDIHPDLIISDVMMPGIDGFMFIEKIKSMIQYINIPIIFLTGLTDDFNKIRGLKAGALHFIRKPFNNEELLLIVANSLNYISKQSNNKKLLNEPVSYTDFGIAVSNIIENEYANKSLNISIIAEKLSVSVNTLDRKFKLTTGYTICKYIHNYRLNKSLSLLKEGKHSIEEIALMSGFGSISYFSRSFKMQFSCSPTSYINKILTEK
jgi:DNA-binding response OmpR family regulator